MTATTLDRVFDGRRFWNLLRCELYLNYRALIVMLGTALGISFTVYFLAAAFGPADVIVSRLYLILTLFAGGFVFSSRAFRDVHKSGADLRYLTLPSSHLEKTLAKFALTGPGYIIFSAAAYFLMTALAALVTLFLFGRSNGLFNPFDALVFKALGIYLVVQSLFVLGSLYFRRLPIAKTLLSLIGLCFAFSLAASLIFCIVNFDLIVKYAMNYAGFSGQPFFPGDFWTGWSDAPLIVFCSLIAPFAWLLTYVRLKEQEVRSV